MGVSPSKPSSRIITGTTYYHHSRGHSHDTTPVLITNHPYSNLILNQAENTATSTHRHRHRSRHRSSRRRTTTHTHKEVRFSTKTCDKCEQGHCRCLDTTVLTQPTSSSSSKSTKNMAWINGQWVSVSILPFKLHSHLILLPSQVGGAPGQSNPPVVTAVPQPAAVGSPVAPVVIAPPNPPQLCVPQHRLNQEWFIGPQVIVAPPPAPAPWPPAPPGYSNLAANEGHLLPTATQVVDIIDSVPVPGAWPQQHIVHHHHTCCKAPAPAPAPVAPVFVQAPPAPHPGQGMHIPPNQRMTVHVMGEERFVIGQDGYVQSGQDGMLWLADAKQWVDIKH